MWCPNCGKPVMGIKTTHRARNMASGFLIPFTGGLSMLGFRVEHYVCPSCGYRASRRADPASRKFAYILTAVAAAGVAIQSWHAAIPILIIGCGVAAYLWYRRRSAIERGPLLGASSQATPRAPAAAAPAKVECPGCGREIPADAVRCHSCGSLLV